MKIHLIKKQTIENFVINNARSRSSFNLWLTAIKFTDWNKPSDIVKTYGSSDLLGNGSDRVVFNIGGNNYRMICKYFFGKRHLHLFICWIGSHAEYNQLCRKNQQFSVNIN
jgi:mRNA interferase HigB